MPLTDNELAALTDREFLEHVTKRLDHLDDMAHETDRKLSEIAAFIEEHRPALARGLALMGGGLGGWIGGKRRAVPQDTQRQVQDT